VLTAGICELTLDTRDMKAMEAFYCAVIGCEVLDREDDRVWLGCGDRSV
jgi:catechol-2,3-dioxygenase